MLSGRYAQLDGPTFFADGSVPAITNHHGATRIGRSETVKQRTPPEGDLITANELLTAGSCPVSWDALQLKLPGASHRSHRGEVALPASEVVLSEGIERMQRLALGDRPGSLYIRSSPLPQDADFR